MFRRLSPLFAIAFVLLPLGLRADGFIYIPGGAGEGQVEDAKVQGKVEQAKEAEEQLQPRIQIALLLDSSSSMSGLISQAQGQLWKIVNEFALAKRGGKPADVTVALYEYGKNTLPADDRYIRKILPLTTDLDKASEESFALKANTISGGDEWCGAVIQAAVNGLAWSPSPDDLKVIFVAGNEPFTNGPVNYRVACKEAITKGIVVNTIHCGPYETGVSQGWKDGARFADGAYSAIDQNRTVTHIGAPQDKEIIRLGVEVNKTYVPFGSSAEVGSDRQAQQDRNAERVGRGTATQRANSKASSLYRNATWDLVDAIKEGKVKLENLKKEQLPKELRELSLEERKGYLDKKAKQRATIQAKIRDLNVVRERYVRELKSKLSSPKGEAAGRTLDEAVIDALRNQARKKGIQIPEPSKEVPGKQAPKKDVQSDPKSVKDVKKDEQNTKGE